MRRKKSWGEGKVKKITRERSVRNGERLIRKDNTTYYYLSITITSNSGVMITTHECDSSDHF